MLGRMWIAASFGKRYLLASLIYAGLALALVCAVPASLMPVATASGTECDAETPCMEGYYCCDGSCIMEYMICCDDGTSGTPETCQCCGEAGSTTALCSSL